MKRFLSILLLGFAASAAHAQVDWPIVLQLKYSPLGIIDADEDKFDHDDGSYEKYEMDFERSWGGRLFVGPIYVAATRNVTDINTPTPDAIVETLSIGLGGIGYDQFASDSGFYLMGGLGVGAGRFKFKQPELNDWEAMIEGNAEIGLRLQEHLLLGVGVDYQHFGEPGESKAHLWNLYIGTGLTF
ncbi:hypothetical protein [Cellvibrio sp. OA-2007]|uniref:hypothetical protein n=1 Tax=Cellvibrio sp. OA-2007 TaxID=529823 RepID=UPI0007830024|nr:hypothetical protein [Cellvibrio sp. OA-2007]